MRYDAFEDLLYCFCDGRTVVLKAWNGLGHAYYRQLDDAFFDAKSGLALLDSSNLKLLDRETHRELLLVREGNSILCAAFTRAAVVLSWVGGPVTAYELKNGHELWTHKPNGTHAYSIATASDDRSVWVAEQRRILRLSSDGEFIDEVSGSLGLSFKVLPYSDSVIRDDLAVTPNVDLKQ
ncbi:MAG: hypothetical protein KDA86_24440 [Planctomycetaceae bacterium]|nr:hypothetical protein [Planctomycetaceae bacterium]